MQALLLAISAVLVSGAVVAADPGASRSATATVFGGELGRWLNQQAIPELVTLVGSHPRFRGEQIRVVTMADGLPTLAGNGLSHALRDRLTQQLTRVKGVQIAWRNRAGRCDLPDKSPYLLGVEIESESRTQSLVTIALVDVEEGIWVSGGYLQWRGTLTQAERRALAQAETAAPVGSIDSPLPDSQRRKIGKLLLQQIECSLRGGLEGGVQIIAANTDDELLGALTQELREALAHSATVSVVNPAQSSAGGSSAGASPAVAEWQLELRAASDVGESVVATLRSSAAQGQRLAAVYVRRSAPISAAASAPTRVEEKSFEPKPLGPARTARASNPNAWPLIEKLHEVPMKPGDTCYRRSAECLEVQFELSTPSYLFVLRTQPGGSGSGGVMNLGSCSSPLRTSGTKRYRMQIRDAGAGFYALATADLQFARRLHRQLAAGARNCGDRVRGDWLDRLETTLAQAEQPVDWRTFHIPARLADDPLRSEAFATRAAPDREAVRYSREN